MGTAHPQIYTTAESPMVYDKLLELLTAASNAIRDEDHRKLYETIRAVTEGVSDLEASADIFIERDNGRGNKIVPLADHEKH